MMNLALTPDVSRGDIFLCPLCSEPVMETVPLEGPIKVPGDERLLGFVLHGIQVRRR